MHLQNYWIYDKLFLCLKQVHIYINLLLNVNSCWNVLQSKEWALYIFSIFTPILSITIPTTLPYRCYCSIVHWYSWPHDNRMAQLSLTISDITYENPGPFTKLDVFLFAPLATMYYCIRNVLCWMWNYDWLALELCSNMI